jgi:ATP-binding cassette subfamily B protein
MATVRSILRLMKPYWRGSLLSLFLLTSVVGMDLAIPRLIQRTIDEGIARQDMAVVLQTAALMLGVSALSIVFALGNNYFSILVGEGVARDLRDTLFQKIQALSYGDLDRFSTGQLIVRLTSDVAAVERVILITLRIGTRAPLLIAGSLILMWTTNAGLALALLPVVALVAAVLAVFSLRMEPHFSQAQQALDRLNTVLQENISGARVVKAFDRAGYEGGRFEAANGDFTARTLEVMAYAASMSPALTLLVNAGMVVVVWSGGLAAIRGELSVGQIVAFTNYLLTTMAPLTLMAMLANIWANGYASMQRIEAVLQTAPEIAEAPGARPLRAPAAGRIAFENASFHYDGAGADGLVLEGVTLAAEPGQRVAVLGATGAGKSSLVNLIPRFYDVAGGRVTIDGQDVRGLSQESLLEHIAIVPQETILFSGTVRDNIRYGKPDASEAEVVAAAQAAQAHEFILNLPQGYDTRVEERGVNLSGGQKQRLAIARALLVRPRILILDDSTSSVDVDTEARIQAALDAWPGERTTFVVAQRISTVLNADRIVVLDKGRVAAQGTHAELMEASPIYREIYDLQLGDGRPSPPEPLSHAERGEAPSSLEGKAR